MSSGPVVVRTNRPSSMARYAPYVRAAGAIVRRGFRTYRNQASQSAPSKSRGVEQTPLYGTAFTSKVAYKRKRVSRKSRQFGQKKFNRFIHQSLKLQQSQNRLTTNSFSANSSLNLQSWFSLDVLNSYALRQLVLSSVGGVNVSLLRDVRLFLRTFSLRYYVTNTGTVPAMVDIYYVHPRRDKTFADMRDPSVPTNGNVLAAWFTANTLASADMNQDENTDVVPNNSQLGFSPFLYQNFCRLFCIDRIREVKLSGGETFTAREVVTSKTINGAELGLSDPAGITTNSMFYNAGYSRVVLFRVRGFPNATDSAAATTMRISWEETSDHKVMETRKSTTGVPASAA